MKRFLLLSLLLSIGLLSPEESYASNRMSEEIYNRRDKAASGTAMFSCLYERDYNGKLDRKEEIPDLENILKIIKLENQFEWVNSQDGRQIVFAYLDLYKTYNCNFETIQYDSAEYLNLFNKYVVPVVHLIQRPNPLDKDEHCEFFGVHSDWSENYISYIYVDSICFYKYNIKPNRDNKFFVVSSIKNFNPENKSYLTNKLYITNNYPRSANCKTKEIINSFYPGEEFSRKKAKLYKKINLSDKNISPPDAGYHFICTLNAGNAINPGNTEKKETKPFNLFKKLFPEEPSQSDNSDNKIRKKCLKAKDYAGCMEYERSQQ